MCKSQDLRASGELVLFTYAIPRKENMFNKALKIAAIATLIVFSCSMFYFFVLRPIHTDNELGRCLEKVEQEHRNEGSREHFKEYCFKQFRH